MAKSLCKWKRAEYASDFKKLKKLVSSPKYVCGKCGRAVRSKKSVCEPTSLD